MKPLFIIGYMCSGKTTFGKALALESSLNFIDLDDYITDKHKSSISEIFASSGEEVFRKIEKEALHETSELNNTVISCGGGTPCFFDNMEFMNSTGITVWLETSRDVLLKRLIEENEHRPLVKGKSPEEIRDIIERHLSLREHFYKKAQIICNGDFLENEEEINSTVRNFLETLHKNTL